MFDLLGFSEYTKNIIIRLIFPEKTKLFAELFRINSVENFIFVKPILFSLIFQIRNLETVASSHLAFTKIIGCSWLLRHYFLLEIPICRNLIVMWNDSTIVCGTSNTRQQIHFPGIDSDSCWLLPSEQLLNVRARSLMIIEENLASLTRSRSTKLVNCVTHVSKRFSNRLYSSKINATACHQKRNTGDA